MKRLSNFKIKDNSLEKFITLNKSINDEENTNEQKNKEIGQLNR